ncbi:ROK family transcriptional regulator [Streptomyces sp. AJS327]|uniref:ROK family transcriptional regulator n=1 Tax=Streptomyces sp. AJS327 TaxID=2545265 RepID=UPI0015DE08E6|nr:ROK family transcriptional regulator [Streptomyces sp. AJS327]MBA0053217.1 ROK family transcriptional regulator [Streptomyces sp. AJS327]
MPSAAHAAPRGLSRTAVLALLGRSGPLSRVEIARQLDLSPATVTQITKRLLAEGLIAETDSVPSEGGRPAIRLSIVADAGRALGVKVAPDHVTVVHVTLDGSVTRSVTYDFDALDDQAADQLVALLAPEAAQPPGSAPLMGVGVGMPGRVDSDGIVDSPVLGWRALPLGRTLSRALGLPVLVDNDVNTVGAAQLLYGHGRGRDDFLVLTLGYGIGLAVVDGGSVRRGATGAAGEIGHVPVTENGRRCRCGNRGCLEAYLGFDGLVRTATEHGLLEAGDTPHALAALAEAGESAALEVLRGAGRLLGRTLAGVANVLDPGAVVVTGEGVALWPYLRDGFEPALRGHLFRPAHGLDVVTDDWDDQAWARGAAAVVLSAPFHAADHGVGPADAVRARMGRAVEGGAR